MLHASRRLRRYFEAHPIRVITDQPIKQILNKAEASGRLTKYSVELGAYDITYIPRSAIKGQVLADFISEVPVGSEGSKEEVNTVSEPGEWVLFTDGASSKKGAGAGLVLIGPSQEEHTYALRLKFESTNNEAEYEALLAGLRIARTMGVERIDVRVDSKLVASQINGEFAATKDSMIRYLAKTKEYVKTFKKFKIQNIPRAQNQKADVLSKLASVAFNHLTKEILVEALEKPSTEEKGVKAIVEEEKDN